MYSFHSKDLLNHFCGKFLIIFTCIWHIINIYLILFGVYNFCDLVIMRTQTFIQWRYIPVTSGGQRVNEWTGRPQHDCIQPGSHGLQQSPDNAGLQELDGNQSRQHLQCLGPAQLNTQAGNLLPERDEPKPAQNVRTFLYLYICYFSQNSTKFTSDLASLKHWKIKVWLNFNL